MAQPDFIAIFDSGVFVRVNNFVTEEHKVNTNNCIDFCLEKKIKTIYINKYDYCAKFNHYKQFYEKFCEKFEGDKNFNIKKIDSFTFLMNLLDKISIQKGNKLPEMTILKL